MESVRTRSRGKQKKQAAESWRGTTDETDVDEEEDGGRSVPVLSGENKRKRAPRGGSSTRRVRLKAMTQYEASKDEKEDEASASTEGGGTEQDDKQIEVESHVEKRRESLRVKMKPLKLRETPAEGKATPKTGKAERKDATDTEAASERTPEVRQRSSNAGPETKLKAETKQRTPATSPPSVQKPVVSLQKPVVQKPIPSQVPSKPSQKTTPTTTANGEKMQKSPAPSNALKSSAELATPETAVKAQEGADEVPETELDISLKVLRKIMKMDAAQPFNNPVDPEAQGVPDYLDVIDTPMDFGTIVDNLVKGVKYKNAFDVYQDIQQIWNNCRKYNRKGDPILELMKKVQKACSKYWTAAGVLRDPKRPKKGEVPPPIVERPAERPSEIFIAKTSTNVLDDPKTRPGAGTTNHKASCGCVVCSAVRRRAAREKRAVGLGSARAVKRQIAKLKTTGKQGMQDMIDYEMEDAMQFEDGFVDHEEEADQFYPSSYQIPLRPLNPVVLSISKTLFAGCRRGSHTGSVAGNPFAALVSSLVQR